MSHIAPSLRPSENATFTLSSSRLPSMDRGRSTIRRYAPCIWYSLTHVLQQSRASPNSWQVLLRLTAHHHAHVVAGLEVGGNGGAEAGQRQDHLLDAELRLVRLPSPPPPQSTPHAAPLPAALSFRSLVLSSSTPQCRAPHPPHTRSPGTTASPSASRAFTNRLNR